jgi:hypothetical protein
MLISDVDSKLPYRLLKDFSVTKHKQKSDTDTVSIVLHDPLRWLLYFLHGSIIFRIYVVYRPLFNVSVNVSSSLVSPEFPKVNQSVILCPLRYRGRPFSKK